MLAPWGNRVSRGIDEIRNLHDYRYDVRTLTKRGLRIGVISVRKSLPKDSTLDQKIIS